MLHVIAMIELLFIRLSVVRTTINVNHVQYITRYRIFDFKIMAVSLAKNCMIIHTLLKVKSHFLHVYMHSPTMKKV